MMSGNIKRFECPVCLEGYGKNVIPKLLSCVHTVCLDCLTGLLRRGTKRNLICPVCRSDINVPIQGADGFKTNIYLLPDKDASVRQFDKTVCSFCAEDEKDSKLLQCGHRLCRNCTHFSESLTHTSGIKQCPICTGPSPNLPGSNLYPVLSTDTLVGKNKLHSENQTGGGQTNAVNSKQIQAASNKVAVSENKLPSTTTNVVYKPQFKPASHMVPTLGMQRHVPVTQRSPETPVRAIPRPKRPAPPRPPQPSIVKGPSMNQVTKPSGDQGLSEQLNRGPSPRRPFQLLKQLLKQVTKTPVAVAGAENTHDSPVVPTAPQLDLFDEKESPNQTMDDVDSPYDTILNVKDPLEGEDWYVGGLTRQESVRELMSLSMEDGIFLVRKNVKGLDDSHAYTIDVLYSRLAYHIKILRLPDRSYILGNTMYKPKEFSDVRSLLDFHKQTPFAMACKETGKEISVTLKFRPVYI